MNEVSELEALYRAVHFMMARLGADGEIDTRAPEVDAVMDAMHEYDGGQYIKWNEATHPQPVTPAGGEVVGDVFVSERGYHSKIHDSVAHLPVGRHKLYLHPPAADAALARDAERYRWLRDECPEAFAMTLVMRREPEEWAAEIDRVIDAALNQRGGDRG